MPRKKKIIKTEPEVKTEIKPEPTLVKNKKEKRDFISITGKRKSAIAQIKFFKNGNGKIIINNKDLKDYFPYSAWQKIIFAPLELTTFKNYEIEVKVKGGGIKAQAESIRLGIAKALNQLNQEFRKILKPVGFLSRDARIKERKKPGLKRARRAPQWSKR